MKEGFAQRLRELRKQKNISQAELGEIVGLHYTHVGRYERGVSRPSADTLKRMADALGVSGDYLMEGSLEDAARARLEDRELVRMFQEMKTLLDEDRKMVQKFLDAFLTMNQIQALAAR